MTWLYRISTGDLFLDGALVGRGYSGHPPYVNDPAACHIANAGPIPPGSWSIVGKAYHHPTLGPVTLALEPKPQVDTFSRTAFRIHGDSTKQPGYASRGCIIMSRPVREMIAAAKDRDLEVRP